MQPRRDKSSFTVDRCLGESKRRRTIWSIIEASSNSTQNYVFSLTGRCRQFVCLWKVIGSQDHHFDPIGWELELEENSKVAQFREQSAAGRGILQIQCNLYIN